jgi:gluconolactonase
VLGANGMGFDAEGNLVLCQHGDRRLAIIENESNLNPSFTTLIDNYEGKKLNSPNDLVFSKTGEIYFTDPAFGFFDLNTFEFVETPLRELDFFGVYKFDTQSKILSLVSDTVDLPNGIGLSPDEKTLYVNKMGMLDQNPKVLKINLEDLSSDVLFDGKELAGKYEGNFDGMVIHSSGNIFTSGPGGLLIISPQGKLLAKINFGHITNCTLDAKEEFLYVTGFLNNPKVFRLKLKT